MDFFRMIFLLFAVVECKIITSDAQNGDFSKLNGAEAISERQAGYGLIKFDGQVSHENNQNNLVTFEDNQSNHPSKFEDAHSQDQDNTAGQNVVFQDESQQNNAQKKRRKRRRKSRRYSNSFAPGGFSPGGPLPAPHATVPMPPGPLRTLSEAFNSILENDDKKCVSRMLCEQAATGVIDVNSNIAKTITTVLQYLPVLQKMIPYSAFPMFTAVSKFALAVNAGQSTKNETVCIRKYPNCPNDPEKRLHYLNNHKGGLSRFFRGQTQILYNPEQFHNKLLGMGLTTHPPNGQHNFPTIAPNVFKYGVMRPPQGANGVHQPYAYGLQQLTGQYGALRPNYQNMQSFTPNKQPLGFKYGFQYPNAGYVNPSQATYSNYGSAYPYHRRFNEDNVRNSGNESDNSKNEIQRRIQNKPQVFSDENIDNEAFSYKWSFPKLESTILKFQSDQNKERYGRQLKFPESNIHVGKTDGVKQAEGFVFPGEQSNRQYLQISSDISDDTDVGDFPINNYKNTDGYNQNDGEEEEVETVYILRGNGDPRRPEIVKLRPGEKIH